MVQQYHRGLCRQVVHYTFFGGKSTGTAGGGGEATCGVSAFKFTNEGKAVKP